MRSLSMRAALVALALPALSTVGAAQQDTTRSRPRAANTVSSGGEVAPRVYPWLDGSRTLGW